jgi:hypothetical protein
MVNPMTGQQTAMYGPTYTTTTKLLGGRTLRRGKNNRQNRNRNNLTKRKNLKQ